MPRSRKETVAVPALLMHVVRAAEAERRRGAQTMGNHSAALADLARLFAALLPARGVLAPDDDLCDEIDRVARRHLQRAAADEQFRSAIARVASVDHRDAIEMAHGRLVGVSELAHYYAGLAAGLTLAGLGTGPWPDLR